MTASTEEPRPRRRTAWSRTTAPTTEPVREVCPYLEAAEGGWRSVQPTREHRCTATAPASPLTLSKQRELCLMPTHRGCATYQAARDVASERPAVPDGGLWPETRGAVLSLEASRSARSTIPGGVGRGSGQAILVGLMVVAFLLLAITRVAPQVSGDAPSSFDAGVIASTDPGPASHPPSLVPASPSADPPASAASSAVPASAGPSPGPSAAPSTAVRATYRVRSGDTLSGIAARYGITVRALKAANAIGSAGVIRPGQVLVIPG